MFSKWVRRYCVLFTDVLLVYKFASHPASDPEQKQKAALFLCPSTAVTVSPAKMAAFSVKARKHPYVAPPAAAGAASASASSQQQQNNEEGRCVSCFFFSLSRLPFCAFSFRFFDVDCSQPRITRSRSLPKPCPHARNLTQPTNGCVRSSFLPVCHACSLRPPLRPSTRRLLSGAPVQLHRRTRPRPGKNLSFFFFFLLYIYRVGHCVFRTEIIRLATLTRSRTQTLTHTHTRTHAQKTPAGRLSGSGWIAS